MRPTSGSWSNCPVRFLIALRTKDLFPTPVQSDFGLTSLAYKAQCTWNKFKSTCCSLDCVCNVMQRWVHQDWSSHQCWRTTRDFILKHPDLGSAEGQCVERRDTRNIKYKNKYIWKKHCYCSNVIQSWLNYLRLTKNQYLMKIKLFLKRVIGIMASLSVCTRV